MADERIARSQRYLSGQRPRGPRLSEVWRHGSRSCLLLAAFGAALLPTTAQAAASAPDRVAPVAFGLALILVAANLGGHVAVRLGQVAVLGELLAGVLLANLPGLQMLRWLHDDPSIDIVARLGALVLLFDVARRLWESAECRS